MCGLDLELAGVLPAFSRSWFPRCGSESSRWRVDLAGGASLWRCGGGCCLTWLELLVLASAVVRCRCRWRWPHESSRLRLQDLERLERL